jgi:hypothetical protein
MTSHAITHYRPLRDILNFDTRPIIGNSQLSISFVHSVNIRGDKLDLIGKNDRQCCTYKSSTTGSMLGIGSVSLLLSTREVTIQERLNYNPVLFYHHLTVLRRQKHQAYLMINNIRYIAKNTNYKYDHFSPSSRLFDKKGSFTFFPLYYTTNLRIVREELDRLKGKVDWAKPVDTGDVNYNGRPYYQQYLLLRALGLTNDWIQSLDLCLTCLLENPWMASVWGTKKYKQPFRYIDNPVTYDPVFSQFKHIFLLVDRLSPAIVKRNEEGKNRYFKANVLLLCLSNRGKKEESKDLHKPGMYNIFADADEKYGKVIEYTEKEVTDMAKNYEKAGKSTLSIGVQ